MAFCAYCGTEVQDARYLCLNCGNPVSGAPRAAVPAPTSKAPIIIILLVVAIPLVIAFLGIIAAIAIPNFVTAVQRSKQKRTQADIRSISTATEAYAVDHKVYPRATGMSSLAPELEPTYIKHVPLVDGWGHPFRYECWSKEGGDDCDAYAFGSSARDGRWEHDALRDYEGDHSTTNFDCDIIFMNGTFVEYPEGISRF